MHPNPAFRTPDQDQNLAFARQRSFATLTLNGDQWPIMAHVPFILNSTGDGAELHLVRSNSIVPLMKSPQPAVLVVSGPDAYVSPDWYGVSEQVPTWNYLAVHLRGTLHQMDQSELPSLLDRLSDVMEARLAPKPIWRRQKMDPKIAEKMMRMIVPFGFQIAEVVGTWKFGQNKPEAARISAAEHVSQSDFGMETKALGALMRNPLAPLMC